jgi:hypothetical protein
MYTASASSGTKPVTKPVSEFPLKKGKTSDKIKTIQSALGVNPTGYWGDQTQTALAKYKVTSLGSDADISSLMAKINADKAAIAASAMIKARKDMAAKVAAGFKNTSYTKLYILRDTSVTPMINTASGWIPKSGESSFVLKGGSVHLKSNYSFEYINSFGFVILKQSQIISDDKYLLVSPYDISFTK